MMLYLPTRHGLITQKHVYFWRYMKRFLTIFYERFLTCFRKFFQLNKTRDKSRFSIEVKISAVKLNKNLK